VAALPIQLGATFGLAMFATQDPALHDTLV
jgi:hypothetical protein